MYTRLITHSSNNLPFLEITSLRLREALRSGPWALDCHARGRARKDRLIYYGFSF